MISAHTQTPASIPHSWYGRCCCFAIACFCLVLLVCLASAILVHASTSSAHCYQQINTHTFWLSFMKTMANNNNVISWRLFTIYSIFFVSLVPFISFVEFFFDRFVPIPGCFLWIWFFQSSLLLSFFVLLWWDTLTSSWSLWIASKKHWICATVTTALFISLKNSHTNYPNHNQSLLLVSIIFVGNGSNKAFNNRNRNSNVKKRKQRKAHS